jgi:quinol monooxygenase YgiN
MAAMSIYLRVEVTVKDGKQAEFEEIAKALVAGSADEPGTLTYRVFSAEPGVYTVVEEYVDAAASRAHSQANRPLLDQLGAIGTFTAFDIFGAEADGLDALAAAIPFAKAHRQVF